MGYKRKIFNDKSIIAAAAVGVMAVSAIVGGAMLAGSDDKDNKAIVDLDEGDANDLLVENESDRVVSDDQNIVAENIDDTADDAKQGQGTSNNNENTQTESESATDMTNKLDAGDTHVEDSEGQMQDDTLLKNQEGDTSENAQDANVTDGILGLNFSPSSTLVWPVEGNVIIDFDMENTVYFATLDLYKCSDSVCVQAAVDTPVYAGSACSIESIEYDSEIGNNVTVSLGNGYMLTYGQLKDVQVESGQVLEEGDLIGYVGNPTKYFTVEGSHLYMKMTHDGVAVDPLDYLNYE